MKHPKQLKTWELLEPSARTELVANWIAAPRSRTPVDLPLSIQIRLLIQTNAEKMTMEHSLIR
jgi:hypothetical protein